MLNTGEVEAQRTCELPGKGHSNQCGQSRRQDQRNSMKARVCFGSPRLLPPQTGWRGQQNETKKLSWVTSAEVFALASKKLGFLPFFFFLKII